jgi:thiosulfate/3-mercaptopyruvate sulfurtransferase
MKFTTLIDAPTAMEHLGSSDWIFVDCRFALSDPEQGFRDYQAKHIKGAVYAHLNKDLSGPIVPGKTGRHPLPDTTAVVQTFSRMGIDSKCQVVAYDDAGGYMAAARLWWLLQWAGHEAVAVLNGGFQEWQRLSYPTAGGAETRPSRTFMAAFKHAMVVDAEKIASVRHDTSYRIVDSRTRDRYRGENETIDPIPGHIPGALNAPFMENLDEAGRFMPADFLMKRFDVVSGKTPARTIFYCGSGVTAAHNVLAFAFARKEMPGLYVGSWSEWITDPTRPISTGSEPD